MIVLDLIKMLRRAHFSDETIIQIREIENFKSVGTHELVNANKFDDDVLEMTIVRVKAIGDNKITVWAQFE